MVLETLIRCSFSVGVDGTDEVDSRGLNGGLAWEIKGRCRQDLLVLPGYIAAEAAELDATPCV